MQRKCAAFRIEDWYHRQGRRYSQGDIWYMDDLDSIGERKSLLLFYHFLTDDREARPNLNNYVILHLARLDSPAAAGRTMRRELIRNIWASTRFILWRSTRLTTGQRVQHTNLVAQNDCCRVGGCASFHKQLQTLGLAWSQVKTFASHSYLCRDL